MAPKKEGKIAAKEVVVAPKAFVMMALHGVRHRHESVHGLLLGRQDNQRCIITVEDAVPVSHGAPTVPIVEAAIGMIQARLEGISDSSGSWTIVGWYTAPMLLDDNKASPPALRMAANLATGSDGSSKMDPVLLVLNNATVAGFLNNWKSTGDNPIQGYGRDFGDQWLEPVSTILAKHSGGFVGTIASKAFSNGTLVNDLVDHLDGLPASSWYPNDEVSALFV